MLKFMYLDFKSSVYRFQWPSGNRHFVNLVFDSRSFLEKFSTWPHFEKFDISIDIYFLNHKFLNFDFYYKLFYMIKYINKIIIFSGIRWRLGWILILANLATGSKIRKTGNLTGKYKLRSPVKTLKNLKPVKTANSARIISKSKKEIGKNLWTEKFFITPYHVIWTKMVQSHSSEKCKKILHFENWVKFFICSYITELVKFFNISWRYHFSVNRSCILSTQPISSASYQRHVKNPKFRTILTFST